MHRIHEQIGVGESAGHRAVHTRTVRRIRVACAAIRRRGDVRGGFFDHHHTIVGFAVVTAAAVVRDPCGSMVERRQSKTGEVRVMTHEAILAGRRQRYVRQGPSGGRRSVMTERAGRVRRIADDHKTRMIESRTEPVTTLRIMALTAILCRLQMAGGLAGCNATVMTLRTTGVLCRECDASQRTKAAMVHRGQRKTPAGRVTIATALAGGGSMNVYENLRRGRRALNG